MSEVAKAAKPMFDKFIDFFDIFDLSFVVSGATFVAAIAWANLTPRLGALLGLDDGSLADIPTLGVFVLIFAAYVSGMTCFAVGRWVRKTINPRRRKRLHMLEELQRHGIVVRDGEQWQLGDHGACISWLPRYLGPEANLRESALYVRMWVEVRQREQLLPSFTLLRRYWVSAATLDGLFVAALTWVLVLALDGGWIPAVVTLIGAGFCLREARRYDDYQREELVATVLHAYDLRVEARSDADEAARQRQAAAAAETSPGDDPQPAAPEPDPAPTSADEPGSGPDRGP